MSERVIKETHKGLSVESKKFWADFAIRQDERDSLMYSKGCRDGHKNGLTMGVLFGLSLGLLLSALVVHLWGSGV